MSTTREIVERLRAVGDIKADDAYEGVDPHVVRAMRGVAEVMREGAARLEALERENARLRAEAEKRERDAAIDRAFNKGGVKNYDDHLAQAWAEIRALNDDLVALPEVPSIDTMRCLLSAGMNIHNPNTGDLGRKLQRSTPMGTIPYASEFECAAGLWVVIREAIIARAALEERKP